jgi:glutamate dehydrogenase (NAD(P)+)
MDLAGRTFIVQGFGNVGSWASRILVAEYGARLVAVQDHTGSIRHGKGIDPEALTRHVASSPRHGVAGYSPAEAIERGEFWRTEADICVPAALEAQLTSETAADLEVQLVAEGANGPTTPKAEAILREKKIDVIPDILCNSGGVIVSYFEWTQNKQGDSWYVDEVRAKLKRRITTAYDKVSDAMNRHKTDRRNAAMIVALERVAASYKERGIFP